MDQLTSCLAFGEAASVDKYLTWAERNDQLLCEHVKWVLRLCVLEHLCLLALGSWGGEVGKTVSAAGADSHELNSSDQSRVQL